MIKQADLAKWSWDDDDEIAITVMLGDHSLHRMSVDQGATLRALCDQLSCELGMHSSADFSCFQARDGIAQHQLLPDDSKVAEVVQTWAKLKQLHEPALVFKRRLLHPEETLQDLDFTHADLTFKQARVEYLAYPLDLREGLFMEIAAELLWLDTQESGRTVNGDTVSAESITAAGVMETLLPAFYLNAAPAGGTWRADAAAMIMPLMNKKTDTGKRKPRFDNMVVYRCFACMQKLQLFGSYVWNGKQTMELPQDKVSVSDAPMTMHVLNRRDPDMEYYICSNHEGVRFYGMAEGWTFITKEFFFRRDAPDRLLSWSAQRDILQLVVSTSGEFEYPRDMSIVVRSAAAVDIVFVMDMFLKAQQARFALNH